ncbi:MAG: DUF5667 domain-containing protein [Anaerolineales bacterium]
MNRQLDEALIEALDLVEQGTPIVKILSRYPELADELRPYLITARDLNQIARPASTTVQEASKREFLRYATSMQVEQRKSSIDRLRDIFVYSLAILLILFFSGAVMAVSSNEAIPGDTLYGTKLFLEQARLNYSADPAAAAALIKALHQERLDEIKTLLALGRSETVTFSGEVEEVSQDRWIVEGLPLAITSSTIIRDEVETGFLVQVRGMTSDGVIVAEQVDVIAGRTTDPDLNNSDSQEQPTPPTPMPTIEPLKIPERPDLLLPDNGQITNPTDPAPVPTTIIDDSINGDDSGHEIESDSQGSQEPEVEESVSQPEKDGSDDGTIDSINEGDELEDGGQSEDDSRIDAKSDDSVADGETEQKDSGSEDGGVKEQESNNKEEEIGSQKTS